MGRPAKPTALHKAQGNPNRLTKAELARREKTEIKFGDNNFVAPTYVKNDVVAYAKWKEIMALYKGVDFVSSGDTGLIARYCLTYADYLRLVDQRNKIDSFECDYGKLAEYFESELLEGLDKFFKFEPVMRLDSAINKKLDILFKMDDRLFLSPLSKVKNIPKKEPETIDPLAAKGFGNI